MNPQKQATRNRIEEIGIIPAVRLICPHDARLVAESVSLGGVPILAIPTTVPNAAALIAELVRALPDTLVGAASVIDADMARACLDAGAAFLTTPGVDREVLEITLRQEAVFVSGAMTPREIIAAWKAGADFINVFPCAQLGGAAYIRAVKTQLPQVPLIASGGVTQQNAGELIAAGAAGLGVGAAMVPHDASGKRQASQIHELARRFARFVKEAREKMRTNAVPIARAAKSNAA